MWSFVTLGYVLGLSMVQIYNLYMGYIFVLCPVICVRFNAFVKNYMLPKNPKKDYLPRNDPLGFIVGFILTGICAFLLSGIMCHY